MKSSLISGACVVLTTLVTGCASSPARDALQIENPTVLERGMATAQNTRAGAATPQWLATYRGVDNDLAYETIQQRLQALGASRDNYFGYKAQCWLDAAHDERSHWNHWGYVEEALREANRLTSGLETGAGSIADNPELRTATVVRPDVWQQILAVKSAATFASCPQAQRLTACAEVEMVHAGHEAWTRDFTGSTKRVDDVAQGLPRVKAALDACAPPPAPPVVSRLPAKITLPGDATFEFDRGDLDGIRPKARMSLDRLIQNLKQTRDVIAIRIDGYTDRLGSAAHNRRLSTERAHTVRQYLTAGGVTVPITAQGSGDDDPLVQCSDKNRSRLIACLAPNRRVELGFERQSSKVQ